MKNYAYIDNQNLYLATKFAPEPWMVDMQRFRVYLREKYKVERAYLFMGAFDEKYENLYEKYFSFGYELRFRQHSESVKSIKKGNVDTDVVFQLLFDSFYDDQFDKVVLVSGDGDYLRTVQHLIKVNKFEKILLPSRKNASSLYKAISEFNKALLDRPDVKRKIKRK